MDEAAVSQLKQRSAEAWGLGDYSLIAELILPVSRALVDACAISAGQEVLDVAAGNGNLTVLAAEEGASVVASDFAPAQVELGKARTAAEGLDVEWVIADAEELPFDDDRFDCAASVFGAQFAPQPERVSRELFRVVKPGGTVGMANWGRYGSQGELFECTAKYGPQLPEGVPNPRDWGEEDIVRERLGPYASSLQLERVTTHWEFESAEHALRTFGSVGPGAAARAAMSEEDRQRLTSEALEVLQRHNKADDGRVVVDPEYLQVVARKRG
jgi:ubiquinone/menaquinone biosynthesis C-methylase UbiE